MNAVGCSVNNLHLKLFPGSNAVLVLLGENAGGCIVHSLLPLCYLCFFLPSFSDILFFLQIRHLIGRG